MWYSTRGLTPQGFAKVSRRLSGRVLEAVVLMLGLRDSKYGELLSLFLVYRKKALASVRDRGFCLML